jgi:molybdopterin-containing oxidoreductase family iron-sulfur binding subunit
MKRTPINWPAPDPSDKVYWRSLDQIAETPEFRDFLHREFPEGASELSSPISRRSFMTLMGASLGLAGLAGCRRPEEKILPYTKAPEEMVIGLPTYYATAMPIGPAVYGVLVESNEGRPTKIEGNPQHPYSLGSTNSFVQAAILDLYDPDRSTSPMIGGKAEEAAAAPAAAEHGGGHGEHGGGHGEHGAAAPEARKFGENDILSILGPIAQNYQGLHILSGAITSPTLLRLRERMKVEKPSVRWHTWEPVSEDNIVAGSQLAFGADLVVHFDFEKADTVLSLGADPFGLHPDAVRNSRGFAKRRRPDGADSQMSRLYVVESAWTVTGTNADHRLRVRPSEVAAFAVALAGELAKRGVALPPGVAEALPKGGASFDAKFLAAVAEDLVQSHGKVVIAVGHSQPKEVHALVHALHSALGAVGNTVSYTTAVDAGRPLDRDSLKDLAAAFERNEVKTLVVLGGNPLYDTPADFGLAEKLEKSKAKLIHIGLYRNETAQAAALHIPATHFLEAWGDARGRDGTASIIQPLIAPLYKGWSEIELVNFLLTGRQEKGFDLVRDTWRGLALSKIPTPPPPEPPPELLPNAPAQKGKGKGAAAAAAAAAAPAPVTPAAPPPGIPNNAPVIFFDRFWRKSLRDGVIEQTAFQAVVPALKAQEIAAALPALSAIKAKELEVLFLTDSKVYDGRFGNNGWLQELPDPVTKLVWDNAALLSMETAKQLGVEKDDLVRITVRGKSVEAAVYVQPGQASGTVALALGYGQKDWGRVVKGAGFNAYQIRHFDGLGFDEAKIEKLGRKYTDPRDEWFGDLVKLTGLVSTQDHFAMEGRPLVREASLTRFRKTPDFAQHAVHHKPLKALWDDPEEFKKGQQWGMTIDLSACVGCGACTVACQAENNIPIVGKAQVRKGREMHWIRIDRYFSFQPQTFEHANDLNDNNTEVAHQPLPCMQCEAAPCENVCPVAATTHSPDGLNDMVYNRCVGTRYCANNCPWKVRRFNFLDFRGDVEEVAKLKYNPDVTLRSRGVMEKCTYCVQRIRGAQRDAKLKLANKQATTDFVADGVIVPACAQACPADAIAFGDILDPKSRVAREKNSPRNYAMLAELNVRPRTTYLARIRNPNPALETERPEPAGHGEAAGHGGGEHGAPEVEHKKTEAGASHQ